MLRTHGALTILTSESLSRAGVVQILSRSTSKSAPGLPVFNDFDFRIALARRRGAIFAKLNFEKCSGSARFYRFWLPNRSRAQAWCKFCRAQLPKVLPACQLLTSFNDFDFQIALARRRGANFVDILGSRSSATPVFRTYLCEPLKRQNYGKTQHFAQFLPAKISQISHLCCKTSLLSNIDAARPTGNFQYSRKLELLNFLWSSIPSMKKKRTWTESIFSCYLSCVSLFFNE